MNKKRLDAFAPWGSAIATTTGIFLTLLFSDNTFKGVVLFFITPFLAYALCTCTHRKNLIYCKTSLASAFGSIVGVYASMWLSYPIILFYGAMVRGTESPWVIVPMIIIQSLLASIFPFYVTRYVCRREQKKHNEYNTNGCNDG